MPRAISAERKDNIREANTELSNWLTRITDIRERLETLVSEDHVVHIGKSRRGDVNPGLRLAFSTLPRKASITVTPNDTAELMGKKYRDGELRDNDHVYSSAIPFAGGVILSANFYPRDETEEHKRPVGFDLLCIQPAHPAYPNDYASTFYLADAVVVSDELLPQVALAVTHTPSPIRTIDS